MDVEAYRRRIAYEGPLTPATATLHGLHAAHLLAVPFENLDISLGRRIVLDDDALFAKIVERRRGGFCYELNGLFAALLRRVGFAVTLLSAAVAHGDGGFGHPLDHLALLVATEERWLVDVGFGDSFLVPLRLDSEDVQMDEHGVYRVASDGTAWTVLRRTGDGDGHWAPQYRFDLGPHTLDEFAARCHYHQTSPASHFTQGRLCSQATPDGRITLRDTRLIVTAHGVKSEQPLSDEQAFRAALRDQFGMVVDS